MGSGMNRLRVLLMTGAALCGSAGAAEKCVTQSQMLPADRDALVAAAVGLAGKIAADDEAGVKATTIAEFQSDFREMAATVASTAPRIKGDSVEVEDVYELDASSLKAASNGVNPDAAFYCTLNKSQAEAEFTIPQLPPGKYAFAVVRMQGTAPWRLSFLLRQEAGQWKLAGLYPKPLTAAGHDGLWYWREARALGKEKEPWNQWLYLQEAQTLLLPANFVSSTHAEKLRDELTGAAPPAVASGLSTDAPLVVKGTDGADFRFTGISVQDAPAQGTGIDVAAHIKVETLGDAAAARKRNSDAAAALLAAHPELRKAFHGVWVFADAPGQGPYATEAAMAEIH